MRSRASLQAISGLGLLLFLLSMALFSSSVWAQNPGGSPALAPAVADAAAGRLDPVIGREREIERVKKDYLAATFQEWLRSRDLRPPR